MALLIVSLLLIVLLLLLIAIINDSIVFTVNYKIEYNRENCASVHKAMLIKVNFRFSHQWFNQVCINSCSSQRGKPCLIATLLKVEED